MTMKRSKRKARPNSRSKLGCLTEKLKPLKVSVRAKVEHPEPVPSCKTRYRGLAKNAAQLFTLFAFANLLLAGRRFAITESRSKSQRQKDAKHRVEWGEKRASAKRWSTIWRAKLAKKRIDQHFHRF